MAPSKNAVSGVSAYCNIIPQPPAPLPPIPGPCPEPIPDNPADGGGSGSTVLFILLGVLLILVIGVIVYIIMKKKRERYVAYHQDLEGNRDLMQSYSGGHASINTDKYVNESTTNILGNLSTSQHSINQADN